jgi:hypothetical protein
MRGFDHAPKKAWLNKPLALFMPASNQVGASFLPIEAIAAYHSCVPGTPDPHDRASTSSGRLAVRDDVAQAQSRSESP